MLEQALWTAADWGAVLPLSHERKPLVSFDLATRYPGDDTDPPGTNSIAALWSRFPDAGVGLALWDAGMMCIDVEHPDKGNGDGFATLRELERGIGQLPVTRTHTTKSGGRHYIFAVGHDSGLRSAHHVMRGYGIGAEGIDFLAGRTVLRWIGTAGYTVEIDHDVMPLPNEWREALADPPAPIRTPRSMEPSDGKHRRYALAGLTSEADALSETAATRNPALARAAFVCGQLIPAVTEEEIEEVLLLACETNGSLKEHGRRACVSTIRRCARAGSKEPRGPR